MQTESGYIPKNLEFDDNGRQKLINGITAISKAVKSTLGPRGRTVLIESPSHTNGITVTKDGVTVARSVALLDPAENLAIQMMQEAANKTATSAGDGTTTAIVLTESLVLAGQEHIKQETNVTEVIKHMNELTTQFVKSLKKSSKKVTPARLKDVAAIAANNDKNLGGIIAEAYRQVGGDGIVTVEKSMNAETYSEVTNGIKVDRGYTTPLFINNQKKDECILEDVKILCCDQEISNILQIENILKPIIQKGEKLLIIGECNSNVVNTLAANVVRNGLKFCNITPPSFGYKTHELMQDIALSVGAKYFSEKTGDDLSLVTADDLGHADKIIIGKESSVLIKNTELSEEIGERIKQLRVQQENTQHLGERKFINERIASLAGSIGAIYVGGNSDVEQKEKFDRVDDSVCAVRSALQEGIVAGGGIALYRITLKFRWMLGQEGLDLNYRVALAIMLEALASPLKQILTNAGIGHSEILDALENRKENDGYDVKNETYGDMYKMGVIDPLKVTKNALINAVSVATTILSTNAIITHKRLNE
tara:strand:+ start:57 stop:1670 length:1614 start_codon:yes stop_codon:yes gene_type:complete